MEKIDKSKYINLLKKYLYPLVFFALIGFLFYEVFFIYSNIVEGEINEIEITAREEKINVTGYNTVIEKDNNKKEVDLTIFNQLQNPFIK